MMDMLTELLHEGNHTLVVSNGETRSYDKRGISALYELLQGEPDFLCGASVADKVVGKGAAALMILGHVKELHADLVSEDALALLRESSVLVTYGNKVPYIRNRAGTGMCPVETLCKGCATAESCLPLITAFYEAQTTSRK